MPEPEPGWLEDRAAKIEAQVEGYNRYVSGEAEAEVQRLKDEKRQLSVDLENTRTERNHLRLTLQREWAQRVEQARVRERERCLEAVRGLFPEGRATTEADCGYQQALREALAAIEALPAREERK